MKKSKTLALMASVSVVLIFFIACAKGKTDSANNSKKENSSSISKSIVTELTTIQRETTTAKTLSSKAERFLSNYEANKNSQTTTISSRVATTKTNKNSSASNTTKQADTVYTTSVAIDTSSVSFPLSLFSNDGKEYLGKLITNNYDSESIWNEYGKYGNEYNTNSIWNEYGKYGNEYSSTSAFNEYASNPPKIVDNDGDFFGYLTENEYKTDGYTIEKLRLYLKENYQ